MMPLFLSRSLVKCTKKWYNYVQKNSEVFPLPQIRPITDLRNTNEISEICHAKNEPILITKNGYGDLVIMSIETYEKLLETNTIDFAIAEADADYHTNKRLLDAREALSSLRRKHFG